jgi:hypothetical protein
MRRLNIVKSRTKFVVAAAVLNAAMLAFVGDASAQEATGVGYGRAHVRVSWSCRLVTMCLVNYCYSETVCDDCANCHASQLRASMREGQKLCKGTACVTRVVTTRRRR